MRRECQGSEGGGAEGTKGKEQQQQLKKRDGRVNRSMGNSLEKFSVPAVECVCVCLFDC